jgi:hypothetical protein
MTEINGQIGTVQILTVDTFACAINTTAFTTYGSAGTVTIATTIPVVTVHLYPIPSTAEAGTCRVRAEGKNLNQVLGQPLVVPVQFFKAALEWLIWEIRRTGNQFDDAARASAKAQYEETLVKAIRDYCTIQPDRTVRQRAAQLRSK